MKVETYLNKYFAEVENCTEYLDNEDNIIEVAYWVYADADNDCEPDYVIVKSNRYSESYWNVSNMNGVRMHREPNISEKELKAVIKHLASIAAKCEEINIDEEVEDFMSTPSVLDENSVESTIEDEIWEHLVKQQEERLEYLKESEWNIQDAIESIARDHMKESYYKLGQYNLYHRLLDLLKETFEVSEYEEHIVAIREDIKLMIQLGEEYYYLTSKKLGGKVYNNKQMGLEELFNIIKESV